MQIGDGTFVPVAGVDYSGLNVITANAATGQACPAIGCTAGTFTWTHRFRFSDTSATPTQSNDFVSITHMMGQTTGTLTTANTNGVDDRAFGVEALDGSAATPFVEQSLAQYNERIISNNAITCSPVSGPPFGETCAAAGRFVTSDTRTSPTHTLGSPIEGLAGVASTASATPSTGFSSCTWCVVGGVFGAFEAANSTAAGNMGYAGGWFGVGASTPNTGGTGAAIVVSSFAGGTRFATANYGITLGDFGTNGSDWAILAASAGPTSSQSYFNGRFWIPGIVPNNGSLAVNGSVAVTGGISTAQLSSALISIFGLSLNGTGGSQTVTYKATCVDANGGETLPSAAATTNGANANMTSTNSISVRISNSNLVGCSSVNIYRTVDAGQCNGVTCTNGKILNQAVSLNSAQSVNIPISFTDTGQVGDGNTAIAQGNTSGGLTLAGNLSAPNACTPGSFAAQTDGATVTWAIASAECANASLLFTTHGGSRTLNLTGLVNGGSYVLKITQDATGGEGLTLGTGCTWKVSGGGSGAITPSTGAGAVDVLAFTYDGTNCLLNFVKTFS
jgi:hypothetical protein